MLLITAHDARGMRPPPQPEPTHDELMSSIDAMIREHAPIGSWIRLPDDLLPGYGVWSWAQGKPPEEALAIQDELVAAGYSFYFNPGGNQHSPSVSVKWDE
jgi:hypothetical protein